MDWYFLPVFDKYSIVCNSMSMDLYMFVCGFINPWFVSQHTVFSKDSNTISWLCTSALNWHAYIHNFISNRVLLYVHSVNNYNDYRYMCVFLSISGRVLYNVHVLSVFGCHLLLLPAGTDPASSCQVAHTVWVHLLHLAEDRKAVWFSARVLQACCILVSPWCNH